MCLSLDLRDTSAVYITENASLRALAEVSGSDKARVVSDEYCMQQLLPRSFNLSYLRSDCIFYVVQNGITEPLQATMSATRCHLHLLMHACTHTHTHTHSSLYAVHTFSHYTSLSLCNILQFSVTAFIIIILQKTKVRYRG